jgi:Ca2+-binding EF-hand superfamily protein
VKKGEGRQRRRSAAALHAYDSPLYFDRSSFMPVIRNLRHAPTALALAAAALSIVSFAPAALAQARDGAGRAAAIFERFDKDKDGFVSEAEFNDARQQRRRGGGGGKVTFADFDTNKDGKLSREEFNAGLLDVAEKAREAIPQFEDYDTNKDGRISEAEFNDARAKRQEADGGQRRGGRGGGSFADMDGNKDGGVTKDEFEAYRAKMREKMQQRQGR